MCTLLGFTDRQMAQRTVRLLYGPDTDPVAVSSAVKRMLLAVDDLYAAAIPALIVYDRSGAPHTVRAVCSRLPARSMGGTGACRLVLEWPPADPPADAPRSQRRRPSLPACLWSVA